MSLRGLVSAAALLGVLGLAQESVEAADPQPYSVTIAETENSALDKAMKNASQLEGLQEKSPVSPFALISRAQADVGRLETVLHSFGYYDGKVTVTIDGRPVGDADLPKTLEAVPAGSSVGVKVAAEPGPLYHLGRIAIVGDVPPDAREKLGLAEGQPAVASDVLAAGARLLSAMQEEGYALANVAPPDATQDPRRHAIDVTFKAAKGRRAVIGPIAVTGLSDVNETFVRRRLLVHSGQLYQPSKIDAARQDLASLGVFSGVSVSAGTQIASDGSIPITYALEERPPRTVGVTGAFSTDLGGSLTTTWSHRNLFGNAEQLNLSAAATGLGGTAVKGLGYNVSAQFLKPDFLQRDQTLEVNAIALKQDLQAYDQRAVTVGGTLRRKLSPLWSVSIGLTAEHETIAQEGVTRAYTLLAVPFTAKFDSTGLTNPLTDPTQGIRATFTATPTQSLGRTSSTFAILQASGSAYFDLGNYWFGTSGRSVLALRGLVGSVQGAGQFGLPPDQRFYGGGSATVRGFKYQSIGPLFPDNNPIGGTSIDAGTVEFRQRLFGDFGFATFVDAGQVSAQSVPFSGTMRIGVGAGLRYYSPIGPVRLDVAVPLNRPPGGDRFEVYLGLGQAF
ncbi:MAG TPA: autotransporter assembly complex family protein [Stellaceae bacterium]|nr:autotransporter assembly complex family protein [Stellaceae bacterium]